MQEVIKIVGGTLTACLFVLALGALVFRSVPIPSKEELNKADKDVVAVVAEVAIEPAVQPKAKPKPLDVNSEEFKKQFRNTIYDHLRKTANPKWDSLVLKDFEVNSDNTVDNVGFQIIYKRHAYKLNSPVHNRDMQNVVDATKDFLQKAGALEVSGVFSGGTLIYCSGQGKRIWDDQLPPVVMYGPLGMAVGIGWQK